MRNCPFCFYTCCDLTVCLQFFFLIFPGYKCCTIYHDSSDSNTSQRSSGEPPWHPGCYSRMNAYYTASLQASKQPSAEGNETLPYHHVQYLILIYYFLDFNYCTHINRTESPWFITISWKCTHRLILTTTAYFDAVKNYMQKSMVYSWLNSESI